MFPAGALEPLGYPHTVFRGMKGYNGVAILSRVPMELHDTAPDWCGKGDCRHVAATLQTPTAPVEVHNFYVPAGGDVPDRTVNPKYGHKLDFIAEARTWFAARTDLSRSVLVGDLNIAPLEHDVWSHKQLLDVVSHTPPETEGLTAWMESGFVDAVRHFVPARPETVFLVVLSQPGLARLQQGTAVGPYLGHARPRRRTAKPDDPARCPRLGARIRPRAGLCGGRSLAFRRRNTIPARRAAAPPLAHGRTEAHRTTDSAAPSRATARPQCRQRIQIPGSRDRHVDITVGVRSTTQSASPALLIWLAEWRDAKISPGSVMVGTPIHSASQVVRPPE